MLLTVKMVCRGQQGQDGFQTGTGSEGAGQRSQLRYHFNVGSVDSFERKLDEAQEDLGWDPANFIPVTYCSEFSLVSEFTKLLPTILIIAGYVWFTRKSMGGLGGGGGPGGRGIFNVGKAQARGFPNILQIHVARYLSTKLQMGVTDSLRLMPG